MNRTDQFIVVVALILLTLRYAWFESHCKTEFDALQVRICALENGAAEIQQRIDSIKQEQEKR